MSTDATPDASSAHDEDEPLHNLPGYSSATVQSRLAEIGVGAYQYLILAGVGSAQLSESLEMGSVAPMHAALSRVYNLSTSERALLPFITFSGSALGLVVAGPLCDWRGRKPALVGSLIIIGFVMFATALLPANTPTCIILGLRFFSGLAGAIQIPAGCVLAIESCPASYRGHLMFAVALLSSTGYLLEAVGVLVLMPDFGESETDHWRAFCFLIGCVALLALPLTMMLYESPSFWAIRGDDAACVGVLDGIAAMNGKAPMQSAPVVETPDRASELARRRSKRHLTDVAGTVYSAATSEWYLLMLLCVIDSSRAFFVSGSAYLWKDLFMMAQGQPVSAAMMNVIASVTPLVGIIIGSYLLWMGARCITFAGSMLAALSLMALTDLRLRSMAVSLLCFTMMAKLTYGPVGTCVALMKAESFPTEVRVSAFSCISIIAKLFCMVAPTLIEILRGGESSSNWTRENLERYIAYLIVATMTCGSLVWAIPTGTGDGKSLTDFHVDEQRSLTISRHGKYGSCANLHDLVPDNSPLRRLHSLPASAWPSA